MLAIVTLIFPQGMLTRPVEFDKFARGLAGPVPYNYSASYAKISVPPSLVQPTSIRRNAQLDVASLRWLLADGLKPRRKGINVTCNHGNAIARLIRLSNRKRDN